MHRLKQPIWTVVEGDQGGGGEGENDSSGDKPQSFSQADVDRIVADRLKRERETTKTKYGDYDDLKAKAQGAKSLEDRVAQMEAAAKEAEERTMRLEVGQAKGLTPRQTARLIGSTREELEADADELLNDLQVGESERKKRGNRVPREGNPIPKPGQGEMRDFARQLFGRE